MRKLLYAGFAASLLLTGCNSDVSEPAETEEPPAEIPAGTVPDENEPVETGTLPKREPTMEAVHSVEGEEITIMMDLAEGSNSLYSLYIDPERYQFERSEKGDTLSSLIPVPEGYPEVNMTFLYVENQTPDSVKEDMKREYSMPLEEKNVTSPVNALSLHGTSGENPDSEVVTMYLMEVGNGTLLIKETYFLEAQEGHGARFEQMLETLEVKK